MTKYVVPMQTWASIVVEVETDETDPEKIADMAIDQTNVGQLCHQCASTWDIGDEYEPITSLTDGKPEVTKVDG